MLKADQLRRSPNQLLAALTRDDLASVAPHVERVTLARDVVLTVPDQPIEAAYFIEAGIASVVRQDGHGERTELCVLGPETLSGGALFGGDGRWPYLTFVQAAPLVAIRVPAAAFTAWTARSPVLRDLLVRSLHAEMIVIAEGLASAAWQKLDARLSRWLLMYRDRMGSDRIEVTHEFMALMVGAQRTGITLALHELEGAGLIAASRGLIVIRDGERLRQLADGSYGIAERERKRLLAR